MYTSLSAGAIGIRVTLAEAIALAKETGFQAVNPSITEAADLVEKHGLQYVKDLFAQSGLRAGDWGMPVNFRKDEAAWQDGLKTLPKLAKLAEQLGWNRTDTWILPFSDELPFDENMRFVAGRLRPIAEILNEHGIRFGLEYIGPATLRAGHKYTFIHDQAGWKQLCAAIGTPNLCLMADAFHWYTSGSTLAEFGTLKNSDIVTLHLNDAIAGVPRDEQLDQVRCLPGEGGVIDLTGFLKTLVKIGYDGPALVEPFSKRVNAMAPKDAARETMQSIKKVFAAAGIR
jgi:sugar phosphate isomerase/epimerase